LFIGFENLQIDPRSAALLGFASVSKKFMSKVYTDRTADLGVLKINMAVRRAHVTSVRASVPQHREP